MLFLKWVVKKLITLKKLFIDEASTKLEKVASFLHLILIPLKTVWFFKAYKYIFSLNKALKKITPWPIS